MPPSVYATSSISKRSSKAKPDLSRTYGTGNLAISGPCHQGPVSFASYLIRRNSANGQTGGCLQTQVQETKDHIKLDKMSEKDNYSANYVQ